MAAEEAILLWLLAWRSRPRPLPLGGLVPVRIGLFSMDVLAGRAMGTVKPFAVVPLFPSW